MKSFDTEQAKTMLAILFQWFNTEQRALPWRVDYQPYHVWISEMMLQQTQMERGVNYFLRWIQRFPTVFEVARAEESEILQAWEGLGYYSRARHVHAAAKIIVEQYDGVIPCDDKLLRALPGIGDYTVAAIMGIAYEQDFPTVDANVERVFSRLCNIDSQKLKPIITAEVRKILPSGKARIFNQAWMEFGALICKKNPQCTRCPIQNFCESYRLGVQHLRPIAKKKAEIVPVYATFCILYHKEKGYLVRKRPNNKGLWANMWEFVGVDSFHVEHDACVEKVSHKKKSKRTKQLCLLPEDERKTSWGDGGNSVDTCAEKNMPVQECPTKQKSKQRAVLHDLPSLARAVLNIELERLFEHDLKLTGSCQRAGDAVHKQQGAPSMVSLSDTFHVVKHSYTHHRLQAVFFSGQIDFDFALKKDYQWTFDIRSIAMSAHHRKAADYFIPMEQ